MTNRFEYWGNTGSSSVTVASDAVSHVSSAHRIFQGHPGEQDAANNFYCGSKVSNPGPGTYRS